MQEERATHGVAIVDDDPQLVAIYERLLIDRKIPVSFKAYDGRVALDMFRRADPRPATIIVDYRMPAMNGIDLMREILKLAPGTKIIFVSADDSIRQETIKMGANAFLRKPVSLNDIVKSISS